MKLSTERLWEIKGNPSPTTTDAEAQSMADEILTLRDQLRVMRYQAAHPSDCQCADCVLPDDM